MNRDRLIEEYFNKGYSYGLIFFRSWRDYIIENFEKTPPKAESSEEGSLHSIIKSLPQYSCKCSK